MGHLKWIHIHTRHKLTKTPKKKQSTDPLIPPSMLRFNLLISFWWVLEMKIWWQFWFQKVVFSTVFIVYKSKKNKKKTKSGIHSVLRQYVVVKVIAVVGLGRFAVFASSLPRRFPSQTAAEVPRVPTSMAKFREPPEARHRNGRTWPRNQHKNI